MLFSRIFEPADDETYDRLKAYLYGHSKLMESWRAIPMQLTLRIYRLKSPIEFAGKGALQFVT